MPISRKPAAFSRVWPFFIASARHFMSITLPRSVRPDACGKHNFTHRQTELDTKGALKTFRSISLPRRDDAPLQPIATPVSKDALSHLQETTTGIYWLFCIRVRNH
jgi:hypothetical protein